MIHSLVLAFDRTKVSSPLGDATIGSSQYNLQHQYAFFPITTIRIEQFWAYSLCKTLRVVDGILSDSLSWRLYERVGI